MCKLRWKNGRNGSMADPLKLTVKINTFLTHFFFLKKL